MAREAGRRPTEVPVQQTFSFEEAVHGAELPQANSCEKAAPPLSEQHEPDDGRVAQLSRLRGQVGCVLAPVFAPPNLPLSSQAFVHSAGCEAIDRLFPRGGLRVASITEWVSESDASGTCAISMASASAALREMQSANQGREQGGPLVVVSGINHFYPPAAAALGMDLGRIIWVQPTTHADAVWAIDQALRCADVAMVWATLGATLDDRDARRFQLAAEIGGTSGFLVRPRQVRHCPTFADVRLHVSHLPFSSQPQNVRARFTANPVFAARVTLDRCRGAASGDFAEVMINDLGRLQAVSLSQVGSSASLQKEDSETVLLTTSPRIRADDVRSKNKSTAMHLASELAHPKVPSRSTRTRRLA